MYGEKVLKAGPGRILKHRGEEFIGGKMEMMRLTERDAVLLKSN
jgi:hypothetical protein